MGSADFGSGRKRMAPALLAGLVLALGACGGDGDGDDGGSGELSNSIVETAYDRGVSSVQLSERAAALRRAQTEGSELSDEQLERRALELAVLAKQLERAARLRGISVSDAEVRRRWEASARQQFQTREALERFLGDQTVDDVLFQLRLQQLSSRIHDQIRRRVGDRRADAAIRRFERTLRAGE